MRAKQLVLCGVLVVGTVATVGCDTFSDLVPGIQSARIEISELRAELTVLTESDDLADQEAASAILSRLEPLESWMALAEEEINRRAEEKVNVWGLADIGIKIAAAAGVPGMGIFALLFGRARKVTTAVVTSIEANRNGDGTVNWAKLREDQQEAGVHEAVRKIRKAEAAKIAAAKATIAVT